MIRNSFLIILLTLLFSQCREASITRDSPLIQLRYAEDYTPTYSEVIEMYRTLDKASAKARLTVAGSTDAGKPLHLFILSNDGDTDPVSIRKKGRSILLINNGIHPGEPCGIDASLKFADELLRGVNQLDEILEHTSIIIVPVYNVGGHLNRSAHHRANQSGPLETGFRGNARKLDLNRDFIKGDSENARSFNRLFSEWQPDVFLDTHTTNGSDHQYSITLIPTNPAALPPAMGSYLREKMLPSLYQSMKEGPYEMTPYVAWINRDPSQGMQMTFESPRYSTGYSRLHHSYGFMTENHVYKSYTDRVESVYHFIVELAAFTSNNSSQIIDSRKQAIAQALENPVYHLDYAVDTTQWEQLLFKGYKAGTYESQLTKQERFGYDRNQPYEKTIRYYSTFQPVKSLVKPSYYLLPSAWHEAVERLKLNGVEMSTVKNDTLIHVEASFFTRVSHPDRPYNGHYFHSEVEYENRTGRVQVFEGDYLIRVNQEKMAYIIECLEPGASDSFFRWNFFDSMLDRREYFSPWGFEENAARYLDEHPEFKAQWEAACKTDPQLINNHDEQMAYLYKHSEWAEACYLRYPVYRLYDDEFAKQHEHPVTNE